MHSIATDAHVGRLVAQIEGLEIGRRAPVLAFWKGSFWVVRPSSSGDD